MGRRPGDVGPPRRPTEDALARGVRGSSSEPSESAFQIASLLRTAASVSAAVPTARSATADSSSCSVSISFAMAQAASQLGSSSFAFSSSRRPIRLMYAHSRSRSPGSAAAPSLIARISCTSNFGSMHNVALRKDVEGR